MSRILRIAITILVFCPGLAGAQDAKATLEAAAAVLGATSLRTIEFSGWGSDYIFGQAYDGNSPWPRFYLPSYVVTIDYTTPSIRDDRRRVQGQNAPRGGAYQPLLGEQRQIWLASGNYAWNLVGDRATPGGFERDRRTALEGRMAQIWLTPHGFVKAGLQAHPTATSITVRGKRKLVVSFTTPTGMKLTGTINEQNLVERIETWLDHSVLGNTMFEAIFTDYKDVAGVKFPMHILQREGGYPVLDVTIADVKANVPFALQVPANIAKPPVAAQAPAQPQKVSDGIWHFAGGSVVVEMRDYVVVVEAPTDEERSIATIDWIKKTAPGKPVRYVVNTHSHFDHAGGVRTFAAEGAMVMTHANNIPYFEQIWANPRTIRPDRLAKSGRKPVFEGVVGTKVLTDGLRSLFIYHYPGNLHNPGMLMVFLPQEKILIEADSFYGMSDDPNDVGAGFANFVHWYETVERLKLDVDEIIPIHGRPSTNLNEARRALELYRDTQIGETDYFVR